MEMENGRKKGQLDGGDVCFGFAGGLVEFISLGWGGGLGC